MSHGQASDRHSRSAFVIPADEAAALLAEGHVPEPVGAELQPPKTVVFVERSRIERMAQKTRIPVRLGSELLAAECLALQRFP